MKEIARIEKGKFAPGTSANPGGRPKGVREVVALARQHTTTAYETLVDVARNGRNEMARVKAAEALLNRGYGSPAVETDLEPPYLDAPTSFIFNPGLGLAQLSAGDEIEGEAVSEEDS